MITVLEIKFTYHIKLLLLKVSTIHRNWRVLKIFYILNYLTKKLINDKWKNWLIYLTHLIKRVKHVLFRVDNLNLKVTHLIKCVQHVNPFWLNGLKIYTQTHLTSCQFGVANCVAPGFLKFRFNLLSISLCVACDGFNQQTLKVALGVWDSPRITVASKCNLVLLWVVLFSSLRH